MPPEDAPDADARTLDELADLLHGIDSQGYGAYKRAKGAWRGDGFTLHIDHVQGDPYATPSKLRFTVPASTHGVPEDAWRTPPRRTGLCDFLLRAFRDACDELPRVAGSGRSGQVRVSVESPAVLPRAGCEIGPDGLTLRFRVGLPAGGRSCYGHSAAELLTEHLPAALGRVRWERLDREGAWSWIRTTEDHAHLQGLLADRGLVAFVREGSLLPRESGVSSKPLPEAVPFRGPETLEVALPTLHHGEVRGTGIPAGVTVLTGGGFHGKTTLLEALQLGVFPHVPGDGREWTVTVPDAVKVRSEEGRAVTGVDLRPFIRDLPLDRSTARFSTADASGSTSLAAAILEALEVGTSLLLMDEDTCATNLLVRDARMQALVRKETITPLIDRVPDLADLGASLVLVTGGGGAYLDVADTVILMEDYAALEVTGQAREIVAELPSERSSGRSSGGSSGSDSDAAERASGRDARDGEHPLRAAERAPEPDSFDARKRSGKIRIRTRGTRRIEFGSETIEIGAVEQLVDYGQARAIGGMLREMEEAADGATPLAELAREAVERARREGLTIVEPSPELALPRPHEVAQVANRLRSLRVEAVSARGAARG